MPTDPDRPDELGALRSPDPASSKRWKVRAISSLLFAAMALVAGGDGLVQLLGDGRVSILPNRPELAGRDAIEAVAIYLGLGVGLAAWGLYARRRAAKSDD